MGHRVGLNYASIQICLMHWPGKKKKKSEMFFLVQAMEHAVLDEISKKRK